MKKKFKFEKKYNLFKNIMSISNNLENILKKWKFPQTIIEKYKSIGIIDIFDWQAECLNNKEISGRKFKFEKKAIILFF